MGPINSNLQQAMYQIQPAQQVAGQVAQSQPQQAINFSGAPVAEKEGGLSLGKIAGLALATIGVVGAIKTHKTGTAFKELEVAGKGEYKFAENFLNNANPLNWFGNAKTVEALTAEGSGFTKLGESGKFFKNGEDILQISGSKVRGLDGKVSEDATKFVDEAKVAAAKAAEAPKTEAEIPKTETPVAPVAEEAKLAEEVKAKATRKAPASADEYFAQSTADVQKLDSKIKSIQSDIKSFTASGNTEKVTALKAKLSLFQDAKEVKLLEERHAKLLSFQVKGQDSQANMISGALDNKLKSVSPRVRKQYESNRAYVENSIKRTVREGGTPTEFEQAYVKFDSSKKKGLFGKVDHIEEGKFVNSADKEINLDKKSSFQTALTSRTKGNAKTAQNQIVLNAKKELADAQAELKKAIPSLNKNKNIKPENMEKLNTLLAKIDPNTSLAIKTNRNWYGGEERVFEVTTKTNSGEVITKEGKEATDYLTKLFA